MDRSEHTFWPACSLEILGVRSLPSPPTQYNLAETVTVVLKGNAFWRCLASEGNAVFQLFPFQQLLLRG